MLALGEDGLTAYIKPHRPVPHQGQEHHRHLPATDRTARRRGTRRPRGTRSAARRRPQDRQCHAQHRLRRSRPSPSTRTSSASPTAPAWHPAKRRWRSRLKLLKVVPDEYRHDAHHWLILHGRYVCKARKPECWRCVVDRPLRIQGKDASARLIPTPRPPFWQRARHAVAAVNQRADDCASGQSVISSIILAGPSIATGEFVR